MYPFCFLFFIFLLCSNIRQLPRSTLFPYTTLFRSFGNCKTRHSYRLLDLSRREDLGPLNIGSDHTRLFQSFNVHNSAFDLVQFRQAYLSGYPADTRAKAKLGQTLLQGHLTALKTRGYGTARARLQTLMAAASRFSQATTNTTTHTLFTVRAAGSGT